MRCSRRDTSPKSYRRIRPSLWVLLFAFVGATIAFVAGEQRWIIGTLGRGGDTYLRDLAIWITIGAAYAFVATVLWIKLTDRVKGPAIVVVFLTLLLSPVMGSQWVRVTRMKTQLLSVTSVRWDRENEEFVVQLESSPAIARAHERGEVRAFASVDGIWVESDGEWGDFAVGPPQLLDRTPPSPPVDSDYSNLILFGVVRVPWSPSQKDYTEVYPCWVKVMLVDEKGEEIGIVADAIFPNVYLDYFTPVPANRGNAGKPH